LSLGCLQLAPVCGGRKVGRGGSPGGIGRQFLLAGSRTDHGQDCQAQNSTRHQGDGPGRAHGHDQEDAQHDADDQGRSKATQCLHLNPPDISCEWAPLTTANTTIFANLTARRQSQSGVRRRCHRNR
jgi:hypothetical protein